MRAIACIKPHVLFAYTTISWLLCVMCVCERTCFILKVSFSHIIQSSLDLEFYYGTRPAQILLQMSPCETYTSQRLFVELLCVPVRHLSVFTGQSSLCHTGGDRDILSGWYFYWASDPAASELPAGLHYCREWPQGRCRSAAVAQLDAAAQHLPYTPGRKRLDEKD